MGYGGKEGVWGDEEEDGVEGHAWDGHEGVQSPPPQVTVVTSI